jgi:hypothetical protein
MKVFWTIILCSLLLFILFFCIGYASLSDTLTVGGEINSTIDAWLYVRTASVKEGTASLGYRGGNRSLTEPAGILFAELDFSNSNQVTIGVTILNNTDYDFVFKSVSAPQIENDSSNTGFSIQSVNGISAETPLGANQTTQEITVTLVSTGVSLAKANLMFNFGFASEEDKDEAVVSEASGALAEALNNPETFTKIEDAMANQGSIFSGSYKASDDYVGNVPGSGTSDSTLITEIFGETLKNVTLDGKQGNECTVMIKQKDILDYNGITNTEEMVLYMTPDTITGTTGFFGSNSNVQVSVYAIVYAKNEEGKWVQYGDMYKGLAYTNAYYATIQSGVACNSFNTESWEHDGAGNYGYGENEIENGDSITDIMTKYVAWKTNSN